MLLTTLLFSILHEERRKFCSHFFCLFCFLHSFWSALGRHLNIYYSVRCLGNNLNNISLLKIVNSERDDAPVENSGAANPKQGVLILILLDSIGNRQIQEREKVYNIENYIR